MIRRLIARALPQTQTVIDMARRLVLAFTAILTVLPPAAAQMYGDHMWQGSWGWGHMIAGAIIMVIFWAAVISLVILLVRWLVGSRNGSVQISRAAALDVLEERYARGEIDRQEFEERRAVLSQRSAYRK